MALMQMLIINSDWNDVCRSAGWQPFYSFACWAYVRFYAL